MSYFLREISKKDIDFINKWRNDREILDFLGAPYRYISEDIDFEWIEKYYLSRDNNIRLAIRNKHSDDTVGVVYLLNINWINRSCEIALMIGNKSLQGKGLGLFSLKEAIKHAFNDLNLNKIKLTVLSYNNRAISLYKKVGFVKEGLLRKEVYKNGRYCDLIQMAIFRE